MSRRRLVSAAARVSYLAEALESRVLLSAYVPPANPRVVTSLDQNWNFILANPTGAQNVGFNDSSWTAVSVPHTWNNLDGQDGGNNYYRGIGWYRSHLTPDGSLTNRHFFLKFDGAFSVA